jgi:hypothetical protein
MKHLGAQKQTFKKILKQILSDLAYDTSVLVFSSKTGKSRETERRHGWPFGAE